MKILILLLVLLIFVSGCDECITSTPNQTNCYSEGESVPVISEQLGCCSGLDLIPTRYSGMVSSVGICTAKCGNGVCDEETETQYNCPDDCWGGGPICGDGICEGVEKNVETREGCPADCAYEPEDIKDY